MSRRAAHTALAICLLVAAAGCAGLAGQPRTATDAPATAAPATTEIETTAPTEGLPTMTDSGATTPTVSPLPVELPAGVDRSEVVRVSSLTPAERETFAAGRNASGYVELPSSGALETFSNHRYVSADGRLWTVRAAYGRVAYSASTMELDANETAVAYDSLSEDRQRRFRRIVDAVGSYTLGPRERAIDFPSPVRYENRTYVVEKGTASSTDGVLAVFPAELPTDTPS
jgi:hypothetical protein